MLAARLYAAGEALRLEELAEPQPSGREVLVRVAGCGVCRTDLHIADGSQSRVDLPLTLGHEVAGYIEAAGREAGPRLRRGGLAIGDAVVVFGGWGCGECAECRAGAEQRCPQGRSLGFQLDGGYAELLLVPDARHLVAIGGLDPTEAGPLADAGVTPYRAVRRAVRWLTPGARVLLNGTGALGTFALQYLRLAVGGNELHVVARDIDPRRLERAAALGADVGVLGGDREMVRDALAGPADLVLDMVGDNQSLAMAADLLTPGGLVMVVGEGGGSLRWDFDALPPEALLTTVAWGSLADLRRVVRLARAGRIRWEVERMPLGEAQAAHERVRNGEPTSRVVLVP